MKNKKTILFLGASITQGRISVSYVKILKKRLGTRQFKYINHGVAGYESYNILNKLEKVFKTKPDFVILLVGTNDVMSSLDPELGKLSRKLKHIPHDPTMVNYSKNITEIIRQLKQNTNATIALGSLPVIGENLDSLENRTVAVYNAELNKISKAKNVAYLPVFEKQRDFLFAKIGGQGADCTNSTRKSFEALLKHYLFFRTLDSISRKNGFLLLTDGIHLNSAGAKYVADEIESFINSHI